MKMINLLMGIWSMMFVIACGNGGQGQVEEEYGASDSEIRLTVDQFGTSGMTMERLEKRSFDEILRVNGVLDVPPQNQASVSAYYGGYVKTITILPGQKVAKGETLFTLENPEYVQMQQEFLETKSQLEYLESDYERQKLLAEQSISSQKTNLKAQADYLSMKAKYASLKKQLSLIHIDTDRLSPENIQSTIAVGSPMNGYINTVNARRGGFLNPDDVALTITNTEHIHLELNVFEADYYKLAKGQPIHFRLQNDDDQTYRAYVYLIGKNIDPEQRAIRVHGHLENEKEGERFAPGMYVEAEIHINSLSGLSLPEEAVVNIGDKYYVLVRKGIHADTTTFEKREVNVGKVTNGYAEVLNHSEFTLDTEFLSKGAFDLIKE